MIDLENFDQGHGDKISNEFICRRPLKVNAESDILKLDHPPYLSKLNIRNVLNIAYCWWLLILIYHLFRTQSTSNEQIEPENRPQLNQISD